jgi:hypothetical protein
MPPASKIANDLRAQLSSYAIDRSTNALSTGELLQTAAQVGVRRANHLIATQRPYNTFRRPFGTNTMWYLHSHFEWLKLSNSSIPFLLDVCLAAHLEASLDGLTNMSNFYCPPAEPIGRAGGSTGWNRVYRQLRIPGFECSQSGTPTVFRHLSAARQ